MRGTIWHAVSLLVETNINLETYFAPSEVRVSMFNKPLNTNSEHKGLIRTYMNYAIITKLVFPVLVV